MRDSTFSSVLLPAPLGPTMPMTSPTPTRNEMSFSAQNFAARSPRPAMCLKRRQGPAAHDVIDSPSVPSPIEVSPIVYSLPSFSLTMASDDIGEPALHLEEVADANPEQHKAGNAGDEDHVRRKRSAEHARPKPRNHADHRVHGVQRVPLQGDD